MLFIKKKSYIISLTIVIATYCIIVTRLFFIITYKKSIIKAYGNNQYFKNITIPTYRYTIYDKNNVPIANTRKTYALYFINDHTLSDKAHTYLTTYFPLSLEEINKNSHRVYLILSNITKI